MKRNRSIYPILNIEYYYCLLSYSKEGVTPDCSVDKSILYLLSNTTQQSKNILTQVKAGHDDSESVLLTDDIFMSYVGGATLTIIEI